MFDIISFGDADFLHDILTFVSISFRDGGIWAVLKMAAGWSMVFAVVQALMGSMAPIGKNMVSIGIIVAVLLGVRVTVRVKDAAGSGLIGVNATDRVVKDVPIGVAAPAGMFSQIGLYLAQGFEGQFKSVTDSTSGGGSASFSYTSSGLMFAQASLEANTKQKIRDPITIKNMNSFWKNCVFGDFNFRKYTETDLMESENVIDFLAKNTSKARSFVYLAKNGEGGREQLTQSCVTGWGFLSKDILEESKKSETRLYNIIANKYNYGRNFEQGDGEEGIDGNLIANSRSSMYSMELLGLIAKNQAASTAQAMIYNSLKGGLRSAAGDADSSTLIQSIAITQARRDMRDNLNAAGILARRYIPMVKNLADAGLFAISPIIFILALMGGGLSVVGHYFKCILALSLWPVMFSILNVTMIIKTKAALVASGVAGANAVGLKFYALSILPDVLQDQAALAGALCGMIPVLSFAIVYGGASSLGSSMGSVAGKGAASAAQTSASMARGNFSMDNQSYGNVTANQQQYSPSYSSGSSSITMGDGIGQKATTSGTFLNVPQSDLPVSAKSGSSKNEQLSQKQSEAYSQMSQAAESRNRSTETALSSAKKDANTLAHSKSVGSESSQTTGDNLSIGDTRKDTAVDSTSKSATTASAATIQGGFSGRAGIGVSGGSSEGGGLPGAGASIGVSGGISQTGQLRDETSQRKSMSGEDSSITSMLHSAQALDKANQQEAASRGITLSNETSKAIKEAEAANAKYEEAASRVRSINEEMARTEGRSYDVSTSGNADVQREHALSGGTIGDIATASSPTEAGSVARENMASNMNGYEPGAVSGDYAGQDTSLNGVSGSSLKGSVESDRISGENAASAKINDSKFNGGYGKSEGQILGHEIDLNANNESKKEAISDVQSDLNKDLNSVKNSENTANNLNEIGDVNSTDLAGAEVVDAFGNATKK